MRKPRHSDYSQDVLANNPELAEALAAGKSIRVKRTKPIQIVNQAPSFNYAWKTTGDHLLGGDLVAEHKFHPSVGWRFDWAFPRYRVAVEVDGGQWMESGGRHARDSDRDKLNAAASMGWIIFRFSPEQLKADPFGSVELIVRALELRAGSLNV